MKMKWHLATMIGLMGALLSAATESRADKITKVRILGGELFATVVDKNGARETAIETENTGGIRHNQAWIIEGGRGLVWVQHAGGGYENEGEAVWSFDLASRQRRRLVSEQVMIDSVREVRSRTGQSAIVVSMSDGGAGIPDVAVAHPRRGRVWLQSPARFVGARNGRIALALYRAGEDSGQENAKRIATVYYDLDALLKGRAHSLKR